MTDMTLEQRITREINIMVMENSWPDLSTRQIADRIINGLGKPERLALLDGEVVSAYVVSRSKA